MRAPVQRVPSEQRRKPTYRYGIACLAKQKARKLIYMNLKGTFRCQREECSMCNMPNQIR